MFHMYGQEEGRRVPHKPLGSSSRPLPVKGVAVSPGPIYNLPNMLGTGPQVSFKHRYTKEEDLIPKPGPGEYNVKGGGKFKSAPGYSFAGPHPPGHAHTARPSPGTASDAGKADWDGAAARGSRKAAQAQEPGPGDYTTDVLDIAKKPAPRTGWVVSKRKEERPDAVGEHQEALPGKTFGRVLKAQKSMTKVPGPGSYTPIRDNKGRHIVGDPEAARRHARDVSHLHRHGDKRHEEFAGPGPGEYDTSQLDISKRASAKPAAMPGRPFAFSGDDTPGPGAYTSRETAVRKAMRGPKFAAPPAKKGEKAAGPGPGEYDIAGSLGSTKTPITFKNRPPPPARSARCPHQPGETVAVQLSATGPKLMGTVKDIWLPAEDDDGTPPPPPAYRVVLEGGNERDVEGHQVARWDGGVGPGAYDPGLGMGAPGGGDGPRHTIQGPSPFTSMSVSESRKTQGNPGPSHYFQSGHLPRGTGRDGKKYTIGCRTDRAAPPQDVGPGGGPSGHYEPKHPSELRACHDKRTKVGISLGGRGDVRVQVLEDVDKVRQLCEDAGILDWKGGKEWMAHRAAFGTDGPAKDSYCGQEGTFLQSGGLTRAKAPSAAAGPNKQPAKGQAGAPWGPYANKARDTIRVVFDDGTVWSYPPAALKRNRLPFDAANMRWPAPATSCEGGPGPVPNKPDTSPKVSIAFRTDKEHEKDGPGPGHYHVPSAFDTESVPRRRVKGAVIGTGA